MIRSIFSRTLSKLSKSSASLNAPLSGWSTSNHRDIPLFVWSALVEREAGKVPSVPSIRLLGDYNTPGAKEAYPPEACKIIAHVVHEWETGKLAEHGASSSAALWAEDAKNYQEQRTRVLQNRPVFETDPTISSAVEASVRSQHKTFPSIFTKPDVVTFAPTWKPHFQIHARNVAGDGRCAVGSDSEDAAVHTFQRSIAAQLVDKASNDGSITSIRTGKPQLRLRPDDAGAIFKRIPAMHETSQVAVAVSGEEAQPEWVLAPAWLIEMTLYLFHNGTASCGASARHLAFYIPKVVSWKHWQTFRAVQDFLISSHFPHLRGHVWNKPQLENPSMLPYLRRLYEEPTVIDVNQGFLDYIEQHLRRTGLSMSQYDALSSQSLLRKQLQQQYPVDRHQLGAMPFMKHYYCYVRQVADQVGKDVEGGMDTRTPSKDPAVFAEQLTAVENQKRMHAWELGTRREWAGHPGIADAVRRPFYELRTVRTHMQALIDQESKTVVESQGVSPYDALTTAIAKIMAEHPNDAAEEITASIAQKLQSFSTSAAQAGSSSAFIESLQSVLKWPCVQSTLKHDPMLVSKRLIDGRSHRPSVTCDELSGYVATSVPTLLNARQMTETVIRYVAAGLSPVHREGCISLRALSSPDPSEERFEDKATAQIGLSALRRLVQLETPLHTDKSPTPSPFTLEYALQIVDETLTKVLLERDSKDPVNPVVGSSEDLELAALMVKLWLTRDDVQADLDCLTAMFRTLDGLSQADPKLCAQLRQQCRQLLYGLYKGTITGDDNIHPDLSVLSPAALRLFTEEKKKETSPERRMTSSFPLFSRGPSTIETKICSRKPM